MTAAGGLRLIVVDPGHFHAALVQREMIEGLSPRVSVHAPLGPELLDYLNRVTQFNLRPQDPTRWALDLQAGPDFIERLRREPPGGVVIFAGRSRRKIDLMEMAVETGLHVLCDKPAIIRREDLDRFAAVLATAEYRGLVVADMMSGRVSVMARLVRALVADADIFGEPVAGTPEEPGVMLGGVHHLFKTVSGIVNRRPPWYFDITEQGEGLADTGVHAVDRVHETLFPADALDYRADIEILTAKRWPTPITAMQFEQVSGGAPWPDYLRPWVSGGRLDYFCNGRVAYCVRGIHTRLDVLWEWEAAAGGDDTQSALFRGTRAQVELRQGESENYRAEIYVLPHANIENALTDKIAALQPEFPGINAARKGDAWHIDVPVALRLGHDPQFAAYARQFLGYVKDPASRPKRDVPNLIAKYHVTTEAVARSHAAGGSR